MAQKEYSKEELWTIAKDFANEISKLTEEEKAATLAAQTKREFIQSLADMLAVYDFDPIVAEDMARTMNALSEEDASHLCVLVKFHNALIRP